MNIFLTDEELIEIRPVDQSEDKGIVIIPKTGEAGESRQEISDLRKEITAIDSINMTTREAAKLHGVGQTNASEYARGKGGLSENARINVLSIRNDIQDLAVTKLMETLNLLDPNLVEKERDKVAIMTGLSQVIEKLNPSKDNDGKPAVHLHLYSPTQKTEKDYTVIDA